MIATSAATQPLCLWTGKDDEGQTRYCHEAPDHEGPHRDLRGFEFTEGAPHPATLRPVEEDEPAPKKKKKAKKKQPTQRTLEYLREQGYLVAVVEKWNPHAMIRQDLFGFIDVLAVRRDETLAVQCCSGGRAAGDRGEGDKGRGSDLAEHLQKIADHPNLFRVREANWRIVIHVWRKNAAGRWVLREEDVS